MRVLYQQRREERPERDRRQQEVLLLLTPCLLIIFKFCLLHRFVFAIHFTAAVQHNFSAVGLIKDDLILSCKGSKLTSQRS